MNHFKSTTSTEPVLMRPATGADIARVWELARLDDKRMPAGPFLVAEVAGEIEAAVSLWGGAGCADPSARPADAGAMLRRRASQVGVTSELAARRAARRDGAERSVQ